jgi:hypothetical protein
MLNSMLVRITQKFHPASLKNIVKLEWLAIVGMLAWLLIIFSIILD